MQDIVQNVTELCRLDGTYVVSLHLFHITSQSMLSIVSSVVLMIE